ncbi:MAG: peroxiredoxin [Bradymonadia bacterium]|jgi:peroxiredoxin
MTTLFSLICMTTSCLLAFAAPPITPVAITPVAITPVAITPPVTATLPRMGGIEVGKPAPWFAGWTLDDRVLNRTRLLATTPTARVHALVFFATWCRPCLKGLTGIAAARARLDAAGVRVVLVDFREDAEAVKPFLKAHGLQGLPVIVDKFGAVAQAFGASDGKTARLPRTVLLDAQGVVRGILAAEGADYVERLIKAVPQPPSDGP